MANRAQKDNPGNDAKATPGLDYNSGEFRVGEKITFGSQNGNIKIRRAPHGDEVEVSESTLAGLMIDAFFSDKLKGQYDTINKMN